MDQSFDAIVVGAGMAGCAAAYSMASQDLNVLLCERSSVAGQKNVSGGVFYGNGLNELIPNFWEDAPVERIVNQRKLIFLDDDSSFSIDLKSEKFEKPPYEAFTVLRAKFDQWFARKAEEAGAILATGLRVDDVVKEGSQVIGVEAGGSRFLSSVVIAADGVNSLLAQKAGLRSELTMKEVNLGVKEILKLPRETIEERFGLEDNQGVASEFVGACTKGVHGGAFLYTNIDTLSLGLIVNLESVVEHENKALELIEEFKNHTAVKRLIKGAESIEYSAHLIPVAGLDGSPKLYSNGMLVSGDAAGFVVATGLVLEGMNYAVASGIAAANAVKWAKSQGDFTEKTLIRYEKELESSYVLPDMRTYRKAAKFMQNPRMYTSYPEFICGLGEKVLFSGNGPKKKVWRLVKDEVMGKLSIWELIKDGISGMRSI